MKNLITSLLLLSAFVSCGSDDETTTVTPANNTGDVSAYTGTGSVTQGLATTTTTNLYPSGQRVAGLGTISSTDNSTWVVPADVNYTDSTFPFASELYNPDGNKYNTSTTAIAALDGSDIVEIDAAGEVITAYIFADNYFEMYVNGTPVGKDAIPFTSFNSHIVRFKVARPFTVAMKLVDWEENLGLGSESQATAYHPGDGGMVAVFKDANNGFLAVTDDTWKAQTYYTSPIQDLTCLTETGTTRASSNCSSADATDGSAFYGIHWEVPTNWTQASFDDSGWPSATTYTNNTIGVDNKESYTNFTDIFDDSTNDAQFIWSTNVVLDNEVIARKTVN
jgi:hypothetical protein